MRYRQETPSGSTIYYIDKLMEIETLGSTVDYRHYLGDVAIVTKTGSLNDPSPSVDYLFRDRLGGVSMIGDAYAAVIEHRGYDAYGKPRNGNWTNKTPATIGSNITDRGFTDHEHLDDWQLIHMNGRGYDYNLGRFLSVDPFIQDPGNSQAINGYSYIGNNPLSGTDPTGYAADTTSLCAGARWVVGCGIAAGMSQTQINASHHQSTGLEGAQLQLLGGVDSGRSSAMEYAIDKFHNGAVTVSDLPSSNDGSGTPADSIGGGGLGHIPGRQVRDVSGL